jgi:hypothetical protein
MIQKIKEAFTPTKKTKEDRDDKSAHRKYTTKYEDLCQ